MSANRRFDFCREEKGMIRKSEAAFAAEAVSITLTRLRSRRWRRSEAMTVGSNLDVALKVVHSLLVWSLDRKERGRGF